MLFHSFPFSNRSNSHLSLILLIKLSPLSIHHPPYCRHRCSRTIAEAHTPFIHRRPTHHHQPTHLFIHHPHQSSLFNQPLSWAVGLCFPICGHFGAIDEIFEGILFTRLLQELWVLVSLVFYLCV